MSQPFLRLLPSSEATPYGAAHTIRPEDREQQIVSVVLGDIAIKLGV